MINDAHIGIKAAAQFVKTIALLEVLLIPSPQKCKRCQNAEGEQRECEPPLYCDASAIKASKLVLPLIGAASGFASGAFSGLSPP